ncbi:MAG: 3-methyl-2-oxobutanoate hydroxymethyltransferase, partial [Candidatus Hermodarchaeota archaeon]|nr:3-methyl-2-oxobutanoate hydroxymethyltransferase [Candidatus Hermodarchaeota archaeon]
GAGQHCDGQVLVVTELLGLVGKDHLPKFVKHYAQLTDIIREAVKEYIDEVIKGKYPEKKHTYH